jgi:hypothetical protein
MWDEPIAAAKASNSPRIRHHKERRSMETARMWPWKLEPSKQCVTAGSPNGLASKMEDAQRRACAGRRGGYLLKKNLSCVGGRGAHSFRRKVTKARSSPCWNVR